MIQTVVFDTKAAPARRHGGVTLDVYEEEQGVFFEDLSGQILQDDELVRLLTFPNVHTKPFSRRKPSPKSPA